MGREEQSGDVNMNTPERAQSLPVLGQGLGRRKLHFITTLLYHNVPVARGDLYGQGGTPEKYSV